MSAFANSARSQWRAARAAPRRRLAAAVLVVVWFTAACTGGEDAVRTDRSAPPSGGSTPEAAGPATAQAAPSAAPAAPAVVLVPSEFSAQATFRSATGNLACRLSGGVICRATEHTWSSRAEDPQEECPPDLRTSGVQLTDTDLQERSDCYDPVEEPSAVLAYGHGLELDGIRCISEARGITCVRTADQVGFSISRSTLSRVPWDSPLLRAPAATLASGSTAVFPPGVRVAFGVDRLADCLLDAGVATCLVSSAASPPPRDTDCELGQALTAEVAGTGRGLLLYDCRSDANGAQDILRAGESVQVGDLRCTAGAERLRCAHEGGRRHGFEIDSSSFRGF